MNNLSLNLAAETGAPGQDSGGIPIAAFSDITRLIERLHRRYLDVIRLELSKRGLDDINAVQAVLLTNVKDAEVSIRELVDRGYYIGSNVTYNVRHLVQCGYVLQSRSERDRRSVKIKLTESGLEVCKLLGEMEQRHADAMGDTGRQLSEVETARNTLRALERVWSDSIQY
ncbi:MAG: MarR family winged helix-turn-helix transcriptional regulator [Alphaproteobacteria bacterium]